MKKLSDIAVNLQEALAAAKENYKFQPKLTRNLTAIRAILLR
jgi:hypothetical protein